MVPLNRLKNSHHAMRRDCWKDVTMNVPTRNHHETMIVMRTLGAMDDVVIHGSHGAAEAQTTDSSMAKDFRNDRKVRTRCHPRRVGWPRTLRHEAVNLGVEQRHDADESTFVL